MRRADGARAWAEVLSELARVAVTVEWEQPAWRVHRRDGPTRRVLMDRAAALGRFRMGSPLPFEQLRFTRNRGLLQATPAAGRDPRRAAGPQSVPSTASTPASGRRWPYDHLT